MEKPARIKIAIVGPESSGKTTLCKKLCRELDADWIPEFAREFLSKQPNYERIDLDFLLQKQLEAEQNSTAPLLFCDGDALSFNVWSEYKFSETSNFILKKVIEMNYNYFLLLKPDLKYENDPLRENSSLKNRTELFKLFEQKLILNNCNYSIISGQKKERVNNAIKALRSEKII